MRQKKALLFLWAGVLVIMLMTFAGCHSTKPTGKAPGKNKPAAKDSATKKIDDGPSEFFQ